jgi:hypothetical protein
MYIASLQALRSRFADFIHVMRIPLFRFIIFRAPGTRRILKRIKTESGPNPFFCYIFLQHGEGNFFNLQMLQNALNSTKLIP